MLKSDIKVVLKAVKHLCKKFNINSNNLEYIGDTDCSWMKKGAKLLNFNILKTGHVKNKSTVGFEYGY